MLRGAQGCSEGTQGTLMGMGRFSLRVRNPPPPISGLVRGFPTRIFPTGPTGLFLCIPPSHLPLAACLHGSPVPTQAHCIPDNPLHTLCPLYPTRASQGVAKSVAKSRHNPQPEVNHLLGNVLLVLGVLGMGAGFLGHRILNRQQADQKAKAVLAPLPTLPT